MAFWSGSWNPALVHPGFSVPRKGSCNPNALTIQTAPLRLGELGTGPRARSVCRLKLKTLLSTAIRNGQQFPTLPIAFVARQGTRDPCESNQEISEDPNHVVAPESH